MEGSPERGISLGGSSLWPRGWGSLVGGLGGGGVCSQRCWRLGQGAPGSRWGNLGGAPHPLRSRPAPSGPLTLYDNFTPPGSRASPSLLGLFSWRDFERKGSGIHDSPTGCRWPRPELLLLSACPHPSSSIPLTLSSSADIDGLPGGVDLSFIPQLLAALRFSGYPCCACLVSQPASKTQPTSA